MRTVKRTDIILIALAVTLTCLIYIPNLGNSLCGMDARGYSKVLTDRDFFKTARLLLLDAQGKVVPGYYAPLGSISLMADKWLIASDVSIPRFTLFVNLMIHCLNGILIYFLLTSLEIDSVVTIITVFLFLIHPLQVSSILWFAERKTVLSAALYLLAYISFVRFVRDGHKLNYGISLGAFAAGLLTKPTVSVLPLVLLVSDLLGVFPKGEAQLAGATSAFKSSESLIGERPRLSGANDRSLLKKLIWVVPFFLMSLVFAFLSLKSEAAYYTDFPLSYRPLIAASAVWFYIWKTLVPSNITFIYPRWHVEPSNLWWWVPLIGLTGCATLLVKFHRRLNKLAIWGLANFLIPLLPAVGLVEFGFFQHSFVANHFMYISMIGMSFVIAFLLTYLIRPLQRPARQMSIAGAACYFALLILLTWHEVKVWESPMILWQDNMQKNPASFAVQFGVGSEFLLAGRLQEAALHLSKSIELNPKNADAYNDLGETFMRLGKREEAMEQYRKAMKARPDIPEAYNNLGNAFLGTGKYEEAVKLFNRAIEVAPSQPEPYMNLGAAYMNLRKTEEATKNFQMAVQLDPRSAKSHANLGFALMEANRLQESLKHLTRAIEIDPGLALAHNALGSICIRIGAFNEAAIHLQKALDIEPNLIQARENLKRLNARSGIRPSNEAQ
ncbi:MAG: tetratricopeptide repeat protein [Desulfomonilaceae bacterium]